MRQPESSIGYAPMPLKFSQKTLPTVNAKEPILNDSDQLNLDLAMRPPLQCLGTKTWRNT